jgi:hypothetical protein
MDSQNDPTRHAKPDWLMKIFIKITGVDEETLRECPQHDWDTVRALGEIMTFTWMYQVALFSLVGHQLFASPGEFRPTIVLVAIFLGTFIMSIDSWLFFRSGWHLSGIDHLLQAGLDIGGGQHARLKANVFLAVRLILSVGMAQLTAIFASLLIFAGTINARIQDTYLKANAHLITSIAAPIDAAIKRATDAVAVQTEHVNALAAQIALLRQHEIDPYSGNPQVREAAAEVTRLTAEKVKADEAVTKGQTFADNEFGGIKGAPGNSGVPGYGLRYRAAMQELADARTRAQQAEADLDNARVRLDALRQPGSATGEIQRAHDQLPEFEKSLDAETAKLADLKKELAVLIAGREDAIRKAMESAPDHVGYDDGFLTRIKVLEQIAQEDGKLATVILLIDLVSFGFELASVLAKVTGYVPTSFAALLARNSHLKFARIVDEIVRELQAIDGWDSKWPDMLPPDGPAGDGHDAKLVPEAEPPKDSNTQPPKRGRGRPRKHPLPGNGITGPNGQQGSSTPPRDPQEPESEA